MNLLNEKKIQDSLKKMKGWSYKNNSIRKEYILKNFSEAVAFIVKAGIESEKIDHHPDLFLHGWNKVTVTLSTHSKGGVTKNDIDLAQLIEKI